MIFIFFVEFRRSGTVACRPNRAAPPRQSNQTLQFSKNFTYLNILFCPCNNSELRITKQNANRPRSRLIVRRKLPSYLLYAVQIRLFWPWFGLGFSSLCSSITVSDQTHSSVVCLGSGLVVMIRFCIMVIRFCYCDDSKKLWFGFGLYVMLKKNENEYCYCDLNFSGKFS